mmetsp:Transcript_1076/g.2615  ORF Transcript_1076/g.2615 Transcript_1076/m.2615 type:complete len:113 (+) Transcript_1076:109-447(+)
MRILWKVKDGDSNYNYWRTRRRTPAESPCWTKAAPTNDEENADAMLIKTLSSLSIKLYRHHRAAADDTAPKRRNSVGKPLYTPRNFVATTHGCVRGGRRGLHIFTICHRGDQ